MTLDQTSPSATVGLEEVLVAAATATDPGPTAALATGFDPLDSVLDGGFLPGELVVVGGRPGVGKTIALVQWARNLARNGHHVVLAQYEHSFRALLVHLCLLELGALPNPDLGSLPSRQALAEVASGRLAWGAAAGQNPAIAQALDAVGTYAPNLELITPAARASGLQGLVDAVEAAPKTAVLMVDHLAKISADPHDLARSAAELKHMAVEADIAVVAATVIADAAMSARRVRISHLREAAAIGHEVDLALVANDKLAAVSKNHSAYDSTRVGDFRNQLVLTVEKNRRGAAGVDLEFTRDYAHRRLEPVGGFVTEMLVDQLLVNE